MDVLFSKEPDRAVVSAPDLLAYEQIMEIDQVKIKVPGWSEQMHQGGGEYFLFQGKRIWVDLHFRILACPFKGGFVHRNFFWFNWTDLGKSCVATVRLSHKTTRAGKVLMLVDVFRAEKGTLAYYEFRFKDKREWDIELPGAEDGGIAFDLLQRPYRQF